MKTVFQIIFFSFLFIFCSKGQRVTAIDTSQIVFKARLLSTSVFGYSSEKQILDDLKKQEVLFLETSLKNCWILKVNITQPFRDSSEYSTYLNQKCSLILAYGTKTRRFYRIGGYFVSDGHDFISDLKITKKNVKSGSQYIIDFNLWCLIQNKNRLRKDKRKINCNIQCSEKPFVPLIITH